MQMSTSRRAAPPWVLRELDPCGEYTVVAGLGGSPRQFTGRALMAAGLAIPVSGGGFDRTHAATVVTVRRAPATGRPAG